MKEERAVDACIAEHQCVAVGLYRTLLDRTNELVGCVDQGVECNVGADVHTVGDGDQHLQRTITSTGPHPGKRGVYAVGATLDSDHGVSYAEPKVVMVMEANFTTKFTPEGRHPLVGLVHQQRAG